MAAPRPLPTPWNLFNLSGSPYFQEALESGDQTPRPLSLFVGRQVELDRLRTTIRSAGGNSTRQAIAGAPGVGKTTLVKELKALALADGYLTTDALVPIFGTDTADSVFGRVLGALYDTIIANRPQAIDNPALRDAQVLVRATRLSTGGGGLSVLGVGGNLTKGTTVLHPGDMMIDGPRVVRDLSRFVQESDARGVLLHLNNMENLTEADAQHAANLLRDLRDPLFLQNGLHFVLVGTTDAVTTVVQTHQQVRNTVSILRLDPLSIADVHAMLAARYAHLQLDADRPALSPVEPAAVDVLNTLFQGDLRGLLKALEDGVEPLLGLSIGDGGAMSQPVTIDALRITLQSRYAAELSAHVEPARFEQLTMWGQQDPTRVHTQKSLKNLWKLKSQSGVSYAVTALVAQGYVVPLPRAGSDPIQYVLSGVSRLIFG
jgi:hypothetical protein